MGRETDGGRTAGWPTRRAFLRSLAAGAALAAAPIGCTRRTMKPQGRFRRVFVLGVDGLDPSIVGEGIRGGWLPSFARLAEKGAFRKLRTSAPAQSPVAWLSLATGMNPGRFGVFDFLAPDFDRYLPALAITKSRGGPTFERPSSAPAFWETAADAGIASTVIRWPMTFPARRGSERLLAGLGVPDIAGAVGRYTYYTTADATQGTGDAGRVVHLALEGRSARASVFGPRVSGLGGTGEAEVPIRFEIDATGARVLIEGPEGSESVPAGSWSGWMRFPFKVGILRRASGMGRFFVRSLDPLAVYLTPIQIDPCDPIYPISNPPGLARSLAEEVGDYYTQGLPEDTKALEEGRIDEETFLSICDAIVAEEERMLERELPRFREGLLAFVFFTTDRIQHIFWGTRDPKHPAYDAAYAKRYGDVIPSYYRRMDAALARILKEADSGEGETLVLVCSDHGFASFRRAFHVDSWLASEGYLAFSGSASPEEPFFRAADWSATKAYSLGFAGIYLNREGREKRGIVAAGDEARALAGEIREKLLALRDPDTGERVVASVARADEIYRGPHVDKAPDLILGLAPGYRFSWQTALGASPPRLLEDNEKKWTGDHLVDPAAVPGILLASERIARDDPSVLDLAPTALEALGLPVTAEIDGASLLAKEGGGGDAKD
ncbi:MAG: alkaline phosphatase family protein [Planctomycetes bacterium]|nr:alkaline phosphatase family protein [Planctomycetota bacterium]